MYRSLSRGSYHVMSLLSSEFVWLLHSDWVPWWHVSQLTKVKWCVMNTRTICILNTSYDFRGKLSWPNIQRSHRFSYYWWLGDNKRSFVAKWKPSGTCPLSYYHLTHFPSPSSLAHPWGALCHLQGLAPTVQVRLCAGGGSWACWLRPENREFGSGRKTGVSSLEKSDV